MAEFILRYLNQFKNTINLRYAVATIILCSLSYVISCNLHTSASSAGLQAASLFSDSDDACSGAAVFLDSNSLLDFTSHHSADVLLAGAAVGPIPQPLPPIPTPPPSLHPQRSLDVDSDSLRLHDVVPMATNKPGRRLLTGSSPGPDH